MLAQNSSNSGLIIYNEYRYQNNMGIPVYSIPYLLYNTCIPNNCYKYSGCFGYGITSNVFYERIISIPNFYQSVVSGIAPTPYYFNYRIGQPNYYLGGIQNNGILVWNGDFINRENQLNYSDMWWYPYRDIDQGVWGYRLLRNSLINNYNHTAPYYQTIQTTSPIVFEYPNHHKYINFFFTPESKIPIEELSSEQRNYRPRIVCKCNAGKIQIINMFDPVYYPASELSEWSYNDGWVQTLNKDETLLLTPRSYISFIDGYGSDHNDMFGMNVRNFLGSAENTYVTMVDPRYNNKKLSIRVSGNDTNYNTILYPNLNHPGIEKIFTFRTPSILHASGVVINSRNQEYSGSATKQGTTNPPYGDPIRSFGPIPTIQIDNNLPIDSIVGFFSNSNDNYCNNKIKYRLNPFLSDVLVFGYSERQILAHDYFKIVDNELRINKILLSDDRYTKYPTTKFVPNNYLIAIDPYPYDPNDTGDLADGLFSTHVFNIQVIQNPNNQNFSLSNDSIYENNSIGETIGIFTPVDNSESYVYELTNGTGSQDNSFFYIGGSYNNELKANSVFDYETKKHYYIRIKRIEKSNNVSTERGFIITIKNRNDKKPDIILLDENTFSIPIWDTAIIGRFSINNFDKYDYYDYYTYSLIPYYDSNGNDISDNSYFFIRNENALCAGKLLSKINPITKNNFFINVRATNKEGLYVDNYFNLTASWIIPDPSLKDGEASYDIILVPFKDKNGNIRGWNYNNFAEMMAFGQNRFALGNLVLKKTGDDYLNTTYHYEFDFLDNGSIWNSRTCLLYIGNQCSSGNTNIDIFSSVVWNSDKMQINLQSEIYDCDYLKYNYGTSLLDCNNNGSLNYPSIKILGSGNYYGPNGTFPVTTRGYPNPESVPIFFNYHGPERFPDYINTTDITFSSRIDINHYAAYRDYGRILYNFSNIIDNYGCRLFISPRFLYIMSFEDIKKLICNKTPFGGRVFNSGTFPGAFDGYYEEYMDFTIWVD